MLEVITIFYISFVLASFSGADAGDNYLGKYNSEANMDVKDALVPTAASAESTFDDSTTPAFTSPTNQFDSNDALLTDEDNTSGKFETVGTCWK